MSRETNTTHTEQTQTGVLSHFTAEENPQGFEHCLQLRRDVFVTEQDGPPEDEPDEHDPQARHWLLCEKGSEQPIATGRLVSYQEGCQMQPVAKIGRLAVAKSHRGQGLGKELMLEMLRYARKDGYSQSILHAQSHAIAFYEALGYIPEGPEFDECGIPHRLMRLCL